MLLSRTMDYIGDCLFETMVVRTFTNRVEYVGGIVDDRKNLTSTHYLFFLVGIIVTVGQVS